MMRKKIIIIGHWQELTLSCENLGESLEETTKEINNLKQTDHDPPKSKYHN